MKLLRPLPQVLDWEIAPKVRSVPGLLEVNTHGSLLKTYEVQVDSDKLMAYHIPLKRVLEALEKNNANAGGTSSNAASSSLWLAAKR